MLPCSSQFLRTAQLMVFKVLKVVFLLLAGAIALTQLVFSIFPLAQHMVANADSLVLFDFARDLLNGHSVRYWNLPRAPYLFPDALLALLLMSLGWWGAVTLTALSVMNLLIVFAVCYAIMRLASGHQKPTALSSALFLCAALLTLSICFPFAMVNIYWQIFASGAHFLSAVIVLLILYLVFLWQLRLRSQWTLIVVFILSAAIAVSDSLASVLLLLWLGVEALWRIGTYLAQKPNITLAKMEHSASSHFFKKQCDLCLVFSGVVLGTFVSLLIPRQSLLSSFLSLAKFKAAAIAFTAWLLGDAFHMLFLMVLIVLILLYPITMRLSYLKGRFSPKNYWRSPVLAPALGIICITPFFYQDVGSIRYLAFPALIAILSLALLYRRLWQWMCTTVYRPQARLLLATLCIALAAITCWQYTHQRIGSAALDTADIDRVGLAVSANASGAAQCIEKAKLQWPLQDGIATYWNARPIRFATNFQDYLAQIDQGRARSGAFIWGNNGIDLVYADLQKQVLRQYNFIVTTQVELNAQLWGNLPTNATGSIKCANHQVFYFADPDLLWKYLFPLQAPYTDMDARHALDLPRADSKMNTYWGEDFFTQVGVRQGNAIFANGKAGILVYGPYIPLGPGHYRLIAQGVLENKTIPSKERIGLLEVGSALGPATIASAPILNTVVPSGKSIAEQTIATVDFKILQALDNVEFRVLVADQTRGVVVRYRLETLP